MVMQDDAVFGMLGKDVTPLFRMVFEMASDPMLVVLLDSFTVVDANQAACNIFGYSARQFSGLRYASLGPDPVFMRQALVKRLSVASGVEHMGRDGKLFFADVSYDYLKNNAHSICLVVLRNVKDQELIEREKQRLEQLSLEVMHTDGAFFLGEDQERKRLGRELHGHIGPMVVSVKLAMEKNLAGSQKSIPKEEVRAMLQQQGEAIRALREVTTRLAEGFQYQEDPNLALRTLMEKIGEYGEMGVYCKLDQLPENLDIALRYHLFRIVEEGLTNVIKHSNATKIALRLKTGDNKLFLSIQDNGNGVGQPSPTGRSGLWFMQKRAELLNGKLRVESVNGKYFRLEMEAPLETKNQTM
jgi:PAS domain S-box-containing protein